MKTMLAVLFLSASLLAQVTTVPNGGTGLSSVTPNGMITGNGTNALNVIAPPTDSQSYSWVWSNLIPSPPAAPTLTAVSGGNIAASTQVNVEVTYLNSSGETTVSRAAHVTTASTCTASGNCSVQVASPAAAGNAVYYCVYAANGTTPGTYYLQESSSVCITATATQIGTNFTFGTTGAPEQTSGVTPPTGNTTGAEAWNLASIPINSQTGTSYMVSTVDRGSVIAFNNSNGSAVTLPQAGTTGFEGNFFFDPWNYGTAGDVTITPAGGTIDGAASLTVPPHVFAPVFSDDTNYFAPLLATLDPATGQLYPSEGGGGVSGLTANAMTCGSSTGGVQDCGTTVTLPAGTAITSASGAGGITYASNYNTFISAGGGDQIVAEKGIDYAVSAWGGSSGAVSVRCDLGDVQSYTLTAAVTGQTASNCRAGSIETLIITESSTGGFAWTWGSSFLGGMTINTAANAVNVQEFVFDGTNWQAMSTGSSH